MDYRATKAKVAEYIKEFSQGIYTQIEEGNHIPDFTPSITMSVMTNRALLLNILKECRDEGLPEGTFFLDGAKDIVEDKERHQPDDEITKIPFQVPEIDWSDSNVCFNQSREVSKMKREYFVKTKPSYYGYKKALRNSMVHGWGDMCYLEGGKEGYELSHIASQCENPWRLHTKIICEDNLFSAKVQLRNYDAMSDWDVVYEIPPLKLTKFLKKIGCSERYCTLVAGKVTNKPRRFTLEFTDRYIPECYMAMSSKVSSCMSYDHSSYDLPDDEHPTLAYEGSPDVLLCLVRDEEQAEAGKPFPYISRGIIRIDKEKWGFNTIYGLEVLRTLKPFGFTNYTEMNGIRLQNITSEYGGTLAPYVDGSECLFDFYDGYLVCTSSGDERSNYETGRLANTQYCDSCCDDYDVEEMCAISDDRSVCLTCRDNYYVWSDHEGEYLLRSDAVQLDNYEWVNEDNAVYSEWYNEYLLSDQATYSDRCDSYIHCDDDEFDHIPLGDHPDDEEDDDEEEEY